jgi:tRNA threonylcarbamoyladenosine biosynthesis protein TsaB
LNVLALETSSEWCSAALWAEGCVTLREERADQRHSALVLPMVAALLHDASVAAARLDGVAFGAGPGSFTGARIACGVAQGLALAAGCPVVGVASLHCLAEASGQARVLACLDARMDEIYFAAYVREGGEWRTAHAPCLVRPDQAPPVEGRNWLGAGNGFLAHRAALEQRYAGQLAEVDGTLYVSAREVVVLGVHALLRGEGIAPELAAPLYLRDKVALSVAERAERKARAHSGAVSVPK